MSNALESVITSSDCQKNSLLLLVGGAMVAIKSWYEIGCVVFKLERRYEALVNVSDDAV